MNTYSLITDTGKSSSVSFLYIIVPFIVAICVDIFFTQVMGSQYCYFNNIEYHCNIHGINAKQWQRETVRSILQFSLIMSLLLLIQKFSPNIVNPLYTSLFGIIGLILLFIGQADLLTDFRRLCNGIVFSIKHN